MRLMKPYSQKIIKPWGYELIFTPPNSPVTGKILHLEKGKRFSYQYHDQKQETLCLLNGEAKIIINEKTIKMKKGKGYFIAPKVRHRCWAITDCDILEASTKEKGNTIRLEDDYHRGTETEEARKKRQTGKIYLG